MRKLKLNKMEKMLFVLPGLMLVAPFLMRGIGLPNPLNLVATLDPSGDLLDKTMRRKVGYAQDCGTIAKFASHAKADACMADAFQAKRPFRMRYEGGDYDSRITVGIVGTAQGEVFEYNYWGRENVYEEKIKNPQVITQNGQSRLNIPNHQGHPESP